MNTEENHFAPAREIVLFFSGLSVQARGNFLCNIDRIMPAAVSSLLNPAQSAAKPAFL